MCIAQNRGQYLVSTASSIFTVHFNNTVHKLSLMPLNTTLKYVSENSLFQTMRVASLIPRKSLYTTKIAAIQS